MQLCNLGLLITVEPTVRRWELPESASTPKCDVCYCNVTDKNSINLYGLFFKKMIKILKSKRVIDLVTTVHNILLYMLFSVSQ